MNEYNAANPPMHLMIKAYLGAGKKRGRARKEMSKEELAELAKHADGQTSPRELAVYKGGRLPKIGEKLWQPTATTELT